MTNDLVQKDAVRKRNIIVFYAIVALVSIGFGMTDGIFNNYLWDTFQVTETQRGLLELPREAPGLLLVVLSSILMIMGNMVMAFAATIIGAVGLIGLGLLTPSYGFMMIWLILFSTGQHLWMPLRSEIGMSLADAGQTGRQLGKFDAMGTAAGVLGSIFILFGFSALRKSGFTYQTIFFISVGLMVIVLILLTMLRLPKQKKQGFKMVIKKEFTLYYLLCIMNGARKQITITFAPWLLIKLFHQDVTTFALLGIATSIAGVVLYPLMGKAIDHFGEKKVLMGEAISLIILCLGFTSSDKWTIPAVGLGIAFTCFVLDKLLAYAGTARSIYVKNIAKDPADVMPTLSMGVSLDHLVSMLVPTLGGLIWEALGFQYVFYGAMLIAGLNLYFATKLPDTRGHMPAAATGAESNVSGS